MESEALLVGIGVPPGPVANYPVVQNGVAFHNPAVITTSVHQPGAILAFHAIAEAMQPEELCDS